MGLETSFPVLYTRLVREGVLSLERLVEAMSTAPGRLFGLGGEIAVGHAADIAVFDLEARYRIDSSDFLSQGHATPLLTLVDGREVYRDPSLGGGDVAIGA